jgi:hypothetical protein
MELKKEKSTAKEVMSGKLESSYDIIRAGKKKKKSKKKMKKNIFKSLKKLLDKK